MKTKEQFFRTFNGVQYQIGKFDNGIFWYPPEMVHNFLNVLGKHYFSNFAISELDEGLINKMCIYFLSTPEQCTEIGLDQNKGLLLYGGTGVGKTTLMQLIPMLQPNMPHIPLVSTSELSEQYSMNGPNAYDLINFSRSFILDDIGSENKSTHYGNTTDVVSDVIKKADTLRNQIQYISINGHGKESKRLRKAIPKNVKIHATTNCDLQQLKERYGDRTTSRMGGLVNAIDFSSKSLDKRISLS